MYLICDLRSKVTSVKVKGHVGQGQRLHWSRSDKDSKERQVGSQQRQVASFKSRNWISCFLCNRFQGPLLRKHFENDMFCFL